MRAQSNALSKRNFLYGEQHDYRQTEDGRRSTGTALNEFPRKPQFAAATSPTLLSGVTPNCINAGDPVSASI